MPAHRFCWKVCLIGLVLGVVACVNSEPKLDATVSNQAAFGNLGPLMDLVARDSTAIHRRDPQTNRTPLHFAAYYGHEGFTRQLIEAGAEVDAQGSDRNTPLQYAAKRGQVVVVDLLLDAGANINRQGKGGDTALHSAVFWGQMTVIDMLLARGADPNIRGYLGWTPLHVACSENRYPEEVMVVVRSLVEHGAIVQTTTDGGTHPIHLAAMYGGSDICEYLLSQGETVEANAEHHSPLAQAARYGHFETVILFVDRGADVKRRDQDGKSPLDLAIASNVLKPKESDLALIEFLLDRGAEVNVPGRNGKPPLHKAVSNEQADVVRILLVHGADPKQRDGVGWPPLHWAASRHNLPIIDMLVDAGADVNARDLSGRTALDHAWSSDSTKARLRDHGAD
jgi:ankyrin repeat protein